jgi:hypothetical protein
MESATRAPLKKSKNGHPLPWMAFPQSASVAQQKFS